MKKVNILLQQEGSDCGIVCLYSLIKYYGGIDTIEHLRRISGTNKSGTTLLGLYQAAIQTGFKAEGCEADTEALIQHKAPVILHVVIDSYLQHYIICYGILRKKYEIQFIIGDPAKGILYLTKNELEAIWVSKKCLTLKPTTLFKTQKKLSIEKKKWLWQLVKDDIHFIAIGAFIGLSIALLGIVMSIFSQRLIDDILPKRDLEKFKVGILLVFLLLIIKEVLSSFRQYLLLRQSKDFNIRISEDFFSKLLHLPKLFFDSRKIGDLTARLNDTSRIQRVISQITSSIVTDILITVVAFCFLFIYSSKTGFVSLMMLPLYFALIYRHNKQIITGQRSIMAGYAMSEANYISTLQGIESIKSHCKEPLFARNNVTVCGKYQGAIFSLGKIQIRIGFLINTCGVIFLLSVLGYNSYEVLQNQLKVGELVAILGMCSMLLPSIGNLAFVSIPINEAKISFDRMFEFAGMEQEMNKGISEYIDFQSLTISNILFRFPGRSPIIKNVSLMVNKGEIISVMGENGCGKSTLSQLLQKHYEFDKGSILVNQKFPLQDISATNWRTIIGVVPQQIHIFNASVLENIAFDDAANHQQKVISFLHEFGFANFIDKLPQSTATLVGEEGINLSGGQKQMIALARALYHQPQLLILDEATASMDKESEQFALQLINKLKPKMGVIFITHKLHILKSFCDRIYIIEKGEIKTFGDHGRLLETSNLYSDYWKALI